MIEVEVAISDLLATSQPDRFRGSMTLEAELADETANRFDESAVTALKDETCPEESQNDNEKIEREKS